MAFLGVDVGTSAVKAVLVDEAQGVLADASVALAVSRPRPLWSEQDPEAWWRAVENAVAVLRRAAPVPFSGVRAIGLSGQMHGAAVLDAADRPLRPAILWNDGRAFAECAELARTHPELPAVVGVPAMPGFTAPKLAWLRLHEPGVFAATRTVLLPKDYVRLRLTGERVSDRSDAAGTWWLDQTRRDWSDAALAATGLGRSHMPRLVDGSESSGFVRPEVSRAWGFAGEVTVAGGAGDAAAGAVGLGAVSDGSAFLSLGTSGQVFVSTAAYRPAPSTLVHAFCHAVQDRWFQMGATLNGASCLSFTAGLLGAEIEDLLREAEAGYAAPSDLLFLPYLSGERTPHNDPHARGVFFGLHPETGRADLARATLEGVAFSLADAGAALAASGTVLKAPGVIGGGARSRFWTRILASVLDRPLTRYAGGDKGPAFGAARLARLAFAGETVEAVCTVPPILDVTEPEPRLVEAFKPRIEAFRRLYRALRPEFAARA